MASELRGKILNVDDIESEMVDVPQWDTKILVKGMTAKRRAQFLRGAAGKDGNMDFEKFYADLVIACAHDPESGEQIFEFADRDSLNGKSGAAVELVATAAMRLSGLGGNAVEEAEQDLGETPSDAST